MTTPSTARKAGPLLGNGSTTSFPFTFKVFAASDVAVSIADSAGVITVLVLDTDYSVSLNANQDTSPGGTITYPISGAALPTGSKLAIIGDLDYDQPLDLPSGGNFSPLALENQLDRATMQIQQLKELSDRSAKMSVYSSAEDVEALTSGIIVLAEISDDIAAVAANEADISTVADNIGSVNAVGGSIGNVDAVAGNATNINAVVANATNINAVGSNIGSVNTVAGNMGTVDTVADNLSLWRDATAADDITVTNFSGTGAQVAFTLPYSPGVENNTQVYISGVYQQKDQYSVSGAVITFSSAPPSGTNNIEVVWSRPFVLGATDSALVSYLPAGTGAVATTVQTKLRESVSVLDFGAVGDGVADDTAAIQAALNTGLSVFLPTGFNCRIMSGLTFTANFQQLYGFGKITANGSIVALTATSKTGIQISGITLVCGDVYTASGILFTSCTQSRVTGCQISKHGAYGVRLVTSSYCSVDENFFTSAALDSRWVTYSSATDIDIEGTNDHHSVKNNLCASAGGYGIGIVTNSASETSNYHNVIGNVIDGYNSYGIYLYRNGDSATGQTVYGNLVNGNTIRNISGARSANPATPAVLDFGAGIYVQGAERTIVNGNSISNTNTSTNTSLLAPGAVGIGSVGDCVVSGNKINDVRNGIYCTDANGYAATTGSLVISGNSIVNATTYGIALTTQSRVQITGNTIHTASYGIFTLGSAATDYLITSNVIRGITNTAISLVSITRQNISANQIYNVTTSHGIALDGCTDLTVETNTINTIGSRGIYVASNCASPITVTNNSVTSAVTGIFVNAFGTVANNTLTSNTTNFAGVAYPFVLLDGTATPNVKGLYVAVSTPGSTLTITNFLNGATGQQLTIQAGNANTTIQHNANIFLSGAVNFVMSSNSTLTLMKSAGIWVETARKLNMTYPLVFYVKTLPPGVGGCANGPVIRILEKYRGDEGMLQHELVHVKQWVRTLMLHPVLYALSKSYKLRCEVEAYREQAKHYADDRRELFAYFIAHRYGLSIPIAEALTLLRA